MRGRRDAFTLVELMIVVGIICLLAVLALPGFLRARERAQNTKFINALRVASSAFDTYATEHNNYPADVNRAIVPPGMSSYFGPTLDWTKPTPIGGQWDWDKDVFGFKAGVSVVSPTATLQQLKDIDAAIDDGDLSSGHFQDEGNSRYTCILE
jgi:prepilin-type N-terminal cleavage/methylation domain-containing protein